ncbi:MAG TPA: GT4 family glycosyltransferase PelF [Candidatus Margulisiibacteriota bacterium]|nr:GT4 family glycosyltransferase PelF [Candidatus Margulisiibacteriota bacterium]
MNILQILPELNVGGVETGTLDLAKYLIRQNHKAVVVSNGGALVGELKGLGAIHYQLPVHRKSFITAFKMVPLLVEIIKKENIDIVHARSRVPAWIAYFACRRTNAVFITTCHGYYQKHPFSEVMGWGKRVVALSNVIARHMVDDFHVPYERIKLVPRSVDLERFKYKGPPSARRKKDFNVGIIGRITPIKGHLHFIKAMAKVSRLLPYLKIWIVGSAPSSREAYKEQLQVLVRRLGLWHCTEFLGAQKDIPEIISQFDLLVLATTTHEAFGRVIVEAQACGVPVVATKVGGVVDIIEDGKTGLLVPPADPAAIAEAVLKIYKDPGLSDILAENAYRKVKEKYNVELMVENTLEVYRDALSNYKALIIKFSSLGDVILSTAAIRAIKEKLGVNYKISFLVGEASKEALLRCPYIDELLVTNLKDKGLGGIIALGRMLRRNNFDLVVDLQNNRKSHILAFLSWAKERYGYDNRKFGFLLNRSVKDDPSPLDPVTHQFRILKKMGIELKDPHLELWPSREDEQYIEQFLNLEWLSPRQKIVGINISASERWPTKNWPQQNIAKFCEAMGAKDIRVVITGTVKDTPSANALLASSRQAKIINACAKTSVNQLACLIKRCSVYVSADSSPLHIASAVGTPFVALFGPTDSRRHLPPGKDFIVLKKDLSCSPCYKTKCRKSSCLGAITPEEVLEAVNALLK